ncbi:Lrp/AsnC ligand binding domain-containing protein [Candidatus Woesearchaeota archaeon]|nr:Lrp/AsnC ligand binding domain-containing protein [Candidatus Woesearchaeota archaeon]
MHTGVRQRNKRAFFTILENKILTHYLCVNPLLVGRAIYRTYFRSPKQVKKYYAQGKKFLKKVQQSTEKWKNPKHQRYVWELTAFRECRTQFERINYHFSIWPWWGIESWGKETTKEDLRKNLLLLQGVEEIKYITGEYDIMLKVRVKDMGELNNLLLTNLRKIPRIGQTNSIFVLEDVR